MAAVAVAFDTLKAATRLQQAGFDKEKAQVLVATFAEGMVENLATKQDLALLATKADLAALRGDLEKTESGLRGEIIKVQRRLTVRMGAAVGAAVAIVVAVDKLR